ncbi:hypothetical protein [Dyadobacter chenhuakuii]|uniref:Uncharacterized protein n=1 Tax=Dyadobacter chenhuakuii TaxID=2909339 RepID=A0ABY4XPV9_9BACT|nr:hypothetical protein [Dyadobacter chenhuakuii]MCF2493359.1 hypothetical protein [Dyadobacter chenhuakuii]USJ32363.1 hypothetical protein NFI80_06370 [Dyadobacter chenhuakuii]
MKILTVTLFSAMVLAEAFFVESHAQKIGSRPAPTGKIPSSGPGQPARPYSEYQPKPTGQIQGATQAADPSVVSDPVPVVQQGQVPKVNTSQDPATMPERYMPATTQPVEQVTEIEQTTTATPQTGSNGQTQTNVQTQNGTTTTQTTPGVMQPATSTTTTTTNRTTTVPATRQNVQQTQPARQSQPVQQTQPVQKTQPVQQTVPVRSVP